MKEFNFEKLSPEGFTYEQSGVHIGYNISHAFVVDCDGLTDHTFRLKDGFTILGYCDAGKLNVRPRPGEYAIKILCVETEEIFWMHLADYQMEYLEENEKKSTWMKK